LAGDLSNNDIALFKHDTNSTKSEAQ